MTPYAIAITTILLAVTVSAVHANNSYGALLPSMHSSSNGNSNDGHFATALLSIPWNGPDGPMRIFNFTDLEPPVAIHLLESYINNYYNITRNSKCPNKNYLTQRKLGSSSDGTSSNNLPMELWSGRNEDKENCQEICKGTLKRACSNTKKSRRGHLFFKAFGIDLNVTYNFVS